MRRARESTETEREHADEWWKNRDNHVGFQIRRLNNLLTCYMDFNMRDILHRMGCEDLTVTQSWVIHFINDHGDSPVYQRDIEERFDISGATVSTMLKLMEKNGYIIRRPVERDARLKQLVLTEKSKNFQNEKEQSVLETEARLREGIEPESMQNFFRCIGQLRENMTRELRRRDKSPAGERRARMKEAEKGKEDNREHGGVKR